MEGLPSRSAADVQDRVPGLYSGQVGRQGGAGILDRYKALIKGLHCLQVVVAGNGVHCIQKARGLCSDPLALQTFKDLLRRSPAGVEADGQRPLLKEGGCDLLRLFFSIISLPHGKHPSGNGKAHRRIRKFQLSLFP